MRMLFATFVLWFAVSLPAWGTAEFDVRQFGAAGDGASDDTAAIQAAADAAGKASRSHYDHRSIHFPPGTYRLSGSIRLANISPRGTDAVI
ncbi:MAG: hypothetical protein IJJ33_01365, partial [Victivallales bacterium]|nr:hypothetical protein [Victivallales bacterium]